MEHQVDAVRTQEMSVQELELAFVVLTQANQRESARENVLIPHELKHLSPLDWEIVDNLLVSLQAEKQWSRVH